jgi:arylsulfatase A-like enzyme
MPHTQPNVILFFTDQQRWDTVGAYRAGPLNLTPNLDRMAAQGTLFENAFTPQPVCAPARGCLQTGMWATQHGVWRNAISLLPETRTLGHRFQDAGYRTGYIGKWHLGPAGVAGGYSDPVPAEYRTGYDHWLASDVLEFTSRPYNVRMNDDDGNDVHLPGYRVDALTDRAIDYIESTDSDQPFFLTVSYIEPHQQNSLDRLVAPDGYAARYKDYPHVPWDLVGTDGDWRKELPDYYGMVARLDEALGRLLDSVERSGLADNTVVLFFSDHGCHFRTRNSEYKRSPHDGAIRIPLVACGPGFDGRGHVSELTSLMDLPPTLCEVAGEDVPDEMGGNSLLALFDERCSDWPDDVFVQISESMVGRAVRTSRWKYCAVAPGLDGWDHKAGDNYTDYCLYDLENDPWEQNNLVGRTEYRDIADEMRNRLLVRMRRAGEGEATIEPAVE